MRALLQRVSKASVEIDGDRRAEIADGLLVLLGVGAGDNERRAQLLAKKVAELRIFADEAGKMNRSLIDVGGECLVVSQFTLYADLRRGRRPHFGDAEKPERASALCEVFVQALRATNVVVQEGVFGANMSVALVNEGPVTIWIDTDAIAPVPSPSSRD